MKIVIKKHVDLAFLGEEYKDAYINFKAIPISDFEQIRKDMGKADENQTAASFLQPFLKKYFVNGKFPDDDGKLQNLDKNDLDGLDSETILECWKEVTGQDIIGSIRKAQGTDSPGAEDIIDPKSPTQ